jgi:hypothetical protein
VRSAEALSAATSQADIYSDYAQSLDSSPPSEPGSMSRASSAVADLADEAEASEVGATSEAGFRGNGNEASLLAHGSDEPVQGVARASAPQTSAAARGPASGHSRTEILVSAVESLHAIAESLPAALDLGAREAEGQGDEGGRHQDRVEREFRVKGKLQEDQEILNLRLRIAQADGERTLPCTMPFRIPCSCPAALL